ncbi:MAG: hypothetical protein WAK62_22060, partial [Terriglobales bacterium]
MEKLKKKPPQFRLLGALEKIFKNKSSKGLQTLIGIRLRRNFYLFKTTHHKVVEGFTDWIGSGDSSALRYLCDFLLQTRLSVQEAHVIGSYIVSVANRYVDGCSGGPDATTIYSDGTIGENSGGPFLNSKARFISCEEQVGKGLRELLFSGGDKNLIIQSASLGSKKEQRT